MAEKQPDLKDAQPGSDADASPTPQVGKTPPNPNDRSKPAPLETGDGELAKYVKLWDLQQRNAAR